MITMYVTLHIPSILVYSMMFSTTFDYIIHIMKNQH